MSGLTVLYEDNHIIVAVKPPMVPSQADASGDADMLTMVREYVREKYNKPGNVFIGLVHRLDRPVGGVMVFARTSKAASRLSEEIRKGGIGKEYVAAVHGTPEAYGLLEDWLLKDNSQNTVKTVRPQTPGAKYAKLEYRLLAAGAKQSLVHIRLHTGRPHQIRVQFSARKHPLVGDMRYGMGEKGRIALWSCGVEITHPTTRERLRFTALPQGGPFAPWAEQLGGELPPFDVKISKNS